MVVCQDGTILTQKPWVKTLSSLNLCKHYRWGDCVCQSNRL